MYILPPVHYITYTTAPEEVRMSELMRFWGLQKSKQVVFFGVRQLSYQW